jgi:hypothetical protein
MEYIIKYRLDKQIFYIEALNQQTKMLYETALECDTLQYNIMLNFSKYKLAFELSNTKQLVITCTYNNFTFNLALNESQFDYNKYLLLTDRIEKAEKIVEGFNLLDDKISEKFSLFETKILEKFSLFEDKISNQINLIEERLDILNDIVLKNKLKYDNYNKQLPVIIDGLNIDKNTATYYLYDSASILLNTQILDQDKWQRVYNYNPNKSGICVRTFIFLTYPKFIIPLGKVMKIFIKDGTVFVCQDGVFYLDELKY